ncbi:DUF262 domain-containing protein [Streptosporangium nondiastaticum]|uniref:DUF262 domain-containing protein n=1 Tax=Streptosporangium nondiastaticum TaxID=35764 RepID=A0A9X7JNN1_9ACTN|nr:DUF262 domain-containing protein [Streptosporangium nondiastaticum]PSJ26976.1 DUF262 domain-containing protein [Streptosporangium nondiastaticum]
MQTSATNKRLRMLLTGIRDKTLIPNPHFQRRLVWSNGHKIAFVATVLDGLPFPEIFISAGDVNPDTGDGTELIVDGQQRITTLHQYFTGSPELRITNSIIPTYKQLAEAKKREFLEYEVVIRDLGPLSEDETRQIFHRINSTNYSLNAMEVNNSRFDGALKAFAEELANHQFFQDRKIFTSLDGRRMNDIRFALTVIITVLSGYFRRDDEHEQYLDHYNDDFPMAGDLRAGFDTVFSFIDDCNFPAKSRVWQKADLFTLIVELYRAIIDEGKRVSPAIAATVLISFYEEVEGVTHAPNPSPEAAEYYRRVRSGINDRNSRINRGAAIQKALSTCSTA